MNEKIAVAIEKDLTIADKPVEEANKPALTLVPAEEKKAKKTKAPRAPRARAVEELLKAPKKSMSDKEKDILLEYYEEQIVLADNKIEAFKQNCDAAYSRARKVEENFNSMESYYKERLAFIHNNAKNFYQSICLATKGDVK